MVNESSVTHSGFIGVVQRPFLLFALKPASRSIFPWTLCRHRMTPRPWANLSVRFLSITDFRQSEN
jgi:hypothetical protein